MNLDEMFKEALKKVKADITKQEVLFYPHVEISKRLEELLIPQDFVYQNDIQTQEIEAVYIGVRRYVARFILLNKSAYKECTAIGNLHILERVIFFYYGGLSFSQQSLDLLDSVQLEGLDIKSLKDEKKRLLDIIKNS